MSLFPTKAHTDWRADTELSDGVAIERRHLLHVSLGALAALTVKSWRPASAQQISKTQAPLSWSTLIERIMPLANQLTENLQPDEDAYLAKLSGLISLEETFPKAFFDLTQAVATHQTLRRFPLLVVQFRLAPGAAIPYHDHRDHIGVLTVTEGAVRIRSFEIVGDDLRPAPGSTFRIRETHNAILTRGAQSNLSRTRGNIHDLRAGPQGARFIDFFTMFRPGAHSTYLDVSEQPRDPGRKIFDANWVKS